MIIIEVGEIGRADCIQKYDKNITWLCSKDIVSADINTRSTNWFIKYIEELKCLDHKYDVVITDYSDNIIKCLESLKMKYALVVEYNFGSNLHELGIYKNLRNNMDTYPTIELSKGETLEVALQDIFKYDWVVDNNTTEMADSISPVVGEQDVDNDKSVEDIALSEVNTVTEEPTDFAIVNKNKLTLKQLIESDIDITESDVRDLKATTNKLKVAMLLQAKSRLNMVLKLSGILDKLYDELVSRIDASIETTDTASLLYTAEQISKALSDTNQFIMTLITNEKIQNFFIIDNSNVINISNDRVDINKREKIRKAAEIVIDNIDYFVQGDFDNIRNPNS